MPKARLTAAFCASATCEPPNRKKTWWDTQTTGLVFEVRPNSKTYALRYIDEHGVQRQHKIARYGDVTFEQAIKTAKRLRSEIVLGGNPAADKAKRKAVPTYGEFAKQHLAFAESLKSYSSIETMMRVHILPRWKNVRLNDIKPQDVASWLQAKDREGLAPASVQKILILFHRSFELAQRWNVPGAPDRNPAKGIPRAKFSNARQRMLNDDELRRLRWAVELSANKQLKHIVGLLLLTGARVGELLQAQWQHVDLERRSWLIPQSKNGRSRNVPLSQGAIDILKQVPRIKDCPWLFPAPRTTKKPLGSIKHAWQTARDLAELPGLRIHDLRHAHAGQLAAANIDLYTISKILGHQDLRSTSRYAYVQNSTMLKAVEAGAAPLNMDWSAAV